MAAIHSATNCASDNFFINIIAPCMVKIARDDCSMAKIDNNLAQFDKICPPNYCSDDNSSGEYVAR